VFAKDQSVSQDVVYQLSNDLRLDNGCAKI